MERRTRDDPLVQALLPGKGGVTPAGVFSVPLPDRCRYIDAPDGGKVLEVTHAYVTIKSGVDLKARLWLPSNAIQHPCPMIIEPLPYGRSTLGRDMHNHTFFASRGIGVVRLDIRGTGESHGLLTDEYTVREQHDVIEAADVLRHLPFADGKWAMFGNSWGAFMAARVAALRPKGLAAIVMSCGTEDRYADDVHFRRGLLVGEMNVYAAAFPNFFGAPPDPELVGPTWEERWVERMQKMEPPVLEIWMRHPDRSTAYWDHASDDPKSSIAVPVLAVGGWADSYTNSVLRMVRAGSGLTKGLIGPGGHGYPDLAWPIPPGGVPFRTVSEHFLRRAFGLQVNDAVAAGEPDLIAFMLAGVPPEEQEPLEGPRKGTWLAINDVNHPVEVKTCTHSLASLTVTHSAQGVISSGCFRIKSPLTLGVAGGKFCPFGERGQIPPDQQLDDVQSLCFEMKVGTTGLKILGAPKLRLRVTSDSAHNHLIVRLCDVGSDGKSACITRGVLNLAHCNGDRNPSALKPGHAYDVDVILDDIAYDVPAGHQLRVAISNQYWPMYWPSIAENLPSLVVDTAESTLELPEYIALSRPVRFVATAAPVGEGHKAVTTLRPSRYETTVTKDSPANAQVMFILDDQGLRRDETGLTVDERNEGTYRIVEGEPLSARSEVRWITDYQRGDWRASVVTVSIISTPSIGQFLVESSLRLTCGERVVLDKNWRTLIPRRHT